MASRTTRQKILYHADKIPQHIARIMEDLLAIDTIAAGRSEPIAEMVPPLMVLFDEAAKTVDHFRDVL